MEILGQSSVALISYGLIGYIVFHLLRNYLEPGLVGIPGPFLAKFTELWKLYQIWNWTFKSSLPGLHEKYDSTLIRVGPKQLSCSDPKAVELIYGFHTDFRKSDMVKAMAPVYQGKKQPTMFAAADNKTHAAIRRPVAGAYSMTKMLQFEPFVNENTRIFYQRLQELFINPGKACDMHNWLQYYAFDIILEMTMSRSLGFMKAGGDVDGVLAQLQKDLDYRGIALAMPIIDRICRLNPISKYFKPKQSAVFALRCKKILADRIAEEKSGKYEVQRQTRPHDFTYAFLEAQRKDPSISDGQLIGYVQANLVAGSDTTAVVMRTALYYTMKQPWIHKRIMAELDAQKELTYPVPYKTARFELPFCAAVVRESLRKHFAFIGMMERQVPDGGAEMPDGRRLPGGTVIGMHGDLIGLNKDIFGQDAHEFNPLRWLPGVEESTFDFERRLKAMNSHDLAFGHGPRGCIGKHVAEMEIYKFVPTFFGLIEPEFTRPGQTWRLRELFVFKQLDMDMQLRWREGKSLASLKL